MSGDPAGSTTIDILSQVPKSYPVLAEVGLLALYTTTELLLGSWHIEKPALSALFTERVRGLVD
jgi:hypothetical protein